MQLRMRMREQFAICETCKQQMFLRVVTGYLNVTGLWFMVCGYPSRFPGIVHAASLIMHARLLFVRVLLPLLSLLISRSLLSNKRDESRIARVGNARRIILPSPFVRKANVKISKLSNVTGYVRTTNQYTTGFKTPLAHATPTA